MKKKINSYDYDTWVVVVGGWGMPDEEKMDRYKRRRLPLPEDIREERRLHMLGLKAKGYPVTWIANLYKISRMHVTRIITNRPNN